MLLAAATQGAPRAEAILPSRPEMVALAEPLPGDRGRGRVGIRASRQAYERLLRAGSALVTDFPLPGGERVDLEVVSFDLSRSGTRFLVGNGRGRVRSAAGPPARFFRGQVAGVPDSLVSLNLIDGRLAGFIRIADREYTVGPGSFSRDRNGAFDIEVSDDETEPGPPWLCDGDDPAVAAVHDSALGGFQSDSMALSGIDGDTMLIAQVAVEGTVEWVNKHGGLSAAQAYTLNLMAQVSAVYEAEVKVQIEVPYVLMNVSEPDGYSGASNNTSTILGEMRAKWNADVNLRNVYRSTTHVFSTHPTGGAGRAYLDVLCSNVPVNPGSYDYGVSLLKGDGDSWERRLVAHELGHNFSSYHSHCYSPEIDQCYNLESGCYNGPEVQSTGTIMSYCDVRLTTFHQRTIDEMLRPAAEAAYPRCMDVAGSPGGLGLTEGDELDVDPAPICGSETLQTDDGSGTAAYGYSGASLATWVKKITPSCYPFKLNGAQVRFSHGATVAPGRPVRILVYTDPDGTGDPANASLAHSEDTVVQVVSASQMNQYMLSEPVILGSGDIYLGFQDLVADSTTNYIMDYDSSVSGDSWWQSNGTDPSEFTPFLTGVGTWMIRGQGSGLEPGSLVLSWGQPCNSAAVPNQDFAIYQGMIGDWQNLSSVTCTTGRATSWFIENPAEGVFWIVVPQTSTSEGSYGLASFGERPPAAAPCKPQEIGVCQ